jgi:small Trp-rich protein
MSDKSSSGSGGIGFFGLLGIVFITLKLAGITEVATWSWWWVTAPLWGGFALTLIAVAILGAISILKR